MAKPVGYLVGGPLCGTELAAGSRPAFIWVAGGQLPDGSQRRPRVFSVPCHTRHLYRSQGVRKAVETFLYAGHTHRCCAECGGFNELGEGEKNPTCQMCGTPLAPDRMAPS